MKNNTVWMAVMIGLFCMVGLNAGHCGGVLSYAEVRQLADRGDAYGQAVLSIHAALGWMTAKDPELAASLAKQSAQQGNALGIYRIGSLVASGTGVAKDEKLGYQLQGKALQGLMAMKGDPYAMTAVGVMLFQGKVVSQDRKRAVEWYKAAAQMGYAPAVYNYLMCAIEGQGMPKDPQMRDQMRGELDAGEEVIQSPLHVAALIGYPPAAGLLSAITRPGEDLKALVPAGRGAMAAASGGGAVKPASEPVGGEWMWDESRKARIRGLTSAFWSLRWDGGVNADNEAEGRGVLEIWSSGAPLTTYRGEMRGGWMEGEVVAEYHAAHQQYEGEIKAWKHHGRGTMKSAQGTAQIGFWKDGNYVGPSDAVAAAAPAAKVSTVVAAAPVGDKDLEGNSGDFGRWAYEFLELSERGRQTFTESVNCTVAHADAVWVVQAFEDRAPTGHSHTELSFYDARTTQLVSQVRVPNVIYGIGRLGKSDRFYVLNGVPYKDRYYDIPLALTLIDPLNRLVEKVDLNVSQWPAQNHRVGVEAGEESVRLLVDQGMRGSYTPKRKRNGPFAGVKVLVEERKRGGTTELGGDAIARLPEEREEASFRQDEAGLAVSGLGRGGSTKGALKEIGFVGVVDGQVGGVHVVRASAGGSVLDLDLGRLQAGTTRVGAQRVDKPGLYADGTLRGVTRGEVFSLKNGSLQIAPIPDLKVDFQSDGALVWKRVGAAGGGVVESAKGEFELFTLDRSGVRQRISIPDAVRDALKANRRAVKEEYQQYKVGFDGRSGSILMHRYSGETADLREPGFGEGEFRMYDGISGALLVSIHAGGGKGGWVEGMCLGTAPQGWRVFSVVTESSTGGSSFGIFVDEVATKRRWWIADGVAQLPSPLVLRVDGAGSARVLYSVAGRTELGAVSLTAANVTKGADKDDLPLVPRVDGEWLYPVAQAAPLFCGEQDLLLVPKPTGYEAFRVFAEAKPKKLFDLIFSGDDGYAVVLPNGVYAGSPGCEAFLKLQDRGGHVMGATALAPWRNRPAEVLKALGGDAREVSVLASVTERWLKRAGVDVQLAEPAAEELPKVAVPSLPPLWAERSRVSFPIEVSAGGADVREVLVRVNGVAAQKFQGAELGAASGKAVLKAGVEVAEGQNWIEVAALDVKGRSSSQARFRTILRESKAPTKRYVVAMGVSKYRDASMNLAFAAKDAADLGAVLRDTGGKGASLLLLRDEEVTGAALGRIREFLASATENDEVIMFCAGHGMLDEKRDYVYAGHDFDAERPGATGILLDDLVGVAASARSLRRLLLLDTCHSGLVGEKEEMLLAQNSAGLPQGVRAVQTRGMKTKAALDLPAGDQQRFIEEMFLLGQPHRGINILGASGGAQYALESAEWSNGIFTASIIEALRDRKADANGDSGVSVSELRDYLAQRVVAQTRGAQKPSVVAFERDQDFSVVRAKLGGAGVAPRSTGSPVAADPVVVAGGGSGVQWPAGLEAFFGSWMQAHAGSSPEAVTRHYAERVDYCYEKGMTPRSKITDDMRRLMTGFPKRAYNDLTVQSVEAVDAEMAVVRYRFRYAYAGRKSAAGVASVAITVRQSAGRWEIVKFSEKTSKE